MAKRVFFSWQADTPTRVGRNFLREVLEDVCSGLSSDTTLDEADRELEVDSDTQGVAGQPPIAETIFKKIDVAAVFLADMTFTGKRMDGRPTPNPNVLIEYGWALKTLTHDRVICVMNSAYGKPNRDNLPFDLAHLRWPIEYDLPVDASPEKRAEEKRRLAKILRDAIPASIKTIPATPAEAPLHFPAVEAKDGPARFRDASKAIGVQDDFFDDDVADVYLKSGPTMWLRVMPSTDSGQRWTPQAIKELSMKSSNLFPLYHSSGGYSYVRGPDGEGVFRAIGKIKDDAPDKVITPSISFAFETGEIWSMDSVLYGYDDEHIHYSEIAQAYENALTRYAQFLRDLGVSPPLHWIAGMVGTNRRRMHYPAEPGKQWISNAGRLCLTDVIEARGEYDGVQDAGDALAPFFDEIFKRCGMARPDYLR